jgi:hypothetical protein
MGEMIKLASKIQELKNKLHNAIPKAIAYGIDTADRGIAMSKRKNKDYAIPIVIKKEKEE